METNLTQLNEDNLIIILEENGVNRGEEKNTRITTRYKTAGKITESIKLATVGQESEKNFPFDTNPFQVLY